MPLCLPTLQVVKVGRTIATVEVRLRDEESGALAATVRPILTQRAWAQRGDDTACSLPACLAASLALPPVCRCLRC
jgi:hypothetical protein